MPPKKNTKQPGKRRLLNVPKQAAASDSVRAAALGFTPTEADIALLGCLSNVKDWVKNGHELPRLTDTFCGDTFAICLSYTADVSVGVDGTCVVQFQPKYHDDLAPAMIVTVGNTPAAGTVYPSNETTEFAAILQGGVAQSEYRIYGAEIEIQTTAPLQTRDGFMQAGYSMQAINTGAGTWSTWVNAVTGLRENKAIFSFADDRGCRIRWFPSDADECEFVVPGSGTEYSNNQINNMPTICVSGVTAATDLHVEAWALIEIKPGHRTLHKVSASPYGTALPAVLAILNRQPKIVKFGSFASAIAAMRNASKHFLQFAGKAAPVVGKVAATSAPLVASMAPLIAAML
jgi:hypothetical protein